MNSSEMQAFSDLSSKVDSLIAKVETLTQQLAQTQANQPPDNTADIAAVTSKIATELAK